MDAWFGALTSLIGVAVGAIATYVSQDRMWRRTTRRDLYGGFVGGCNAAFEAALAVRYAVRHKDYITATERAERWDSANSQVGQVAATSAQLTLVAGTKTREAARRLADYLTDLKSELYLADGGHKELLGTDEYRAQYQSLLDAFLAAASRELGLSTRR
jgi:hypothetical protein